MAIFKKWCSSPWNDLPAPTSSPAQNHAAPPSTDLQSNRKHSQWMRHTCISLVWYSYDAPTHSKGEERTEMEAEKAPSWCCDCFFPSVFCWKTQNRPKQTAKTKPLGSHKSSKTTSTTMLVIFHTVLGRRLTDMWEIGATATLLVWFSVLLSVTNPAPLELTVGW